MPLDEIAPGFVTGLIGGVSSGFLGISPGGALVVLSVLLLGCDQHIAQRLSLVAQILPTSPSGIKRYREHGYRSRISWLFLLTIATARFDRGRTDSGLTVSPDVRQRYLQAHGLEWVRLPKLG
jgi:uncharacterized membrane protein YfcA